MPKTRCSGRQAGPNIDVYTVAMPTRDAHDGTAHRGPRGGDPGRDPKFRASRYTGRHATNTIETFKLFRY